MQFIAIEVLFTCLFDYKALFVSVQDSTCLRMAIPAYCFNICLLIEKSNEKTCKNISEKEKQSKYFSMNNGCYGRVLGGRGDRVTGTVVLFKSCMTIKTQTKYC